jgi:tetratricopeptide (TPR) repeat protein
MPETLPVDPAGAGASRDPEREARIEQLLLSGLDHYFAGKFEEAINIWTRVAFLERGHGRARAYIERARGAQAERQREHEELLHSGVAAYQAGDMETARTLLTRAIEEGGPTDVALAFLQRLNRFEAAAEHGRLPVSRIVPGGCTSPQAADGTRWVPTVVASGVMAIAIVLLALPIASWIAELPIGPPPAEAARPEPLPIVRTSEMTVARARALYDAGKLKDALSVLDRVSPADPSWPDADHLRALVQRDVLAAAGLALDQEKGPAR